MKDTSAAAAIGEGRENNMEKRLALAVVLCFASFLLVNKASAGLLLYEPFDYASGSTIVPGTTAINGGLGLVDTYPPVNGAVNGNPWLQAGTFTTGHVAHQITGSTATVWGASSLPAPAGFAPGQVPTTNGNAAALMGGASTRGDNTEMARMNLPSQYGAGSVLYYSMLLHVSDLAGLTVANTNANATNDLIVGFNNLNTVGSNTRPNTWAGELKIRQGSAATTTYNLGVGSTSTVGGTSYWSGDFTTSDTLFVVGRYTAGATAGTNSGVNDLWINPSSLTYGALTAPLPNGSTVGEMSLTAANDHVDSFLIGAGIGAGTNPNETNIDELRIGTTWLDVTPEPGSLSLLLIGAAGFIARRRRV